MTCLAALIGLAAVTQDPTPTFTTTDFAVAEANRLALTPRLDGSLAQEEWDALADANGARSYFQWEPGVLYAAAKLPKGKDWLLSLDVDGDGWLIGRDNYEVRVSWGDGAPRAQIRLLDATQRDAPAWVEVPFLQGLLKSAGSEDADGWTVELKIVGTMLPMIGLGRSLGVRTDAVDAATESPAAFVPRKTALVTLRWDRSRGLPSGMEWGPEYRVRSAPPGDRFRIRFTFRNPGDSALRRAEFRAEGFARESMAVEEQPFPAFDRKGRSFMDYETLIDPEASRGYRVARARLTGEKGEDVLIQTSFRIADLVEFDTVFPKDLRSKPESQLIRASVVLKSQTRNRVDGVFTVSLPDGWSVAEGADRKFLIYHPRGNTRIGLELIAPAGARGLVPIELKATIGDRVVQQTTAVVLP